MLSSRIRIERLVRNEARKAQAAYGDYASMHEAYGVMAEEFAELLDAVRLRQSDPMRGPSIEQEAIQVAAIAMRMAAQARKVTR